MIKHFYSHIVEVDTVLIELDSLDLKPHEKEHLERLMESQIHHTIVHTVMTELSQEDKKDFLDRIHSKDYEKVWKLLHKKIDRAEEKIKKAAAKITKELLEDIKNLRNK